MNGTAETTWPSRPRIEVSWVSSGIRNGLNQEGISLRTDTNAVASPTPSRTLAARAEGTSCERAMATWARATRRAPPPSMRRGPHRSRASPTGICATP